MIKYDSTIHSLDDDFDFNKEETKEIHSLINRKNDININDIRRITLWKYNRVLGIDESTIKKLQNIATKENLDIDSPLVKELIKGLVSSGGVGYPLASTILKFIRPDIFPIIDVRAYRAIEGEKIASHQYNYDLYIDYAKKLKDIADDKGIPLKEVDEQLYCLDKKLNGKI